METDIFHVLVHSLDDCSLLVRARLMLGIRNSILVSHMGGRSMLPSQAHLQEAGSEIEQPEADFVCLF